VGKRFEPPGYLHSPFYPQIGPYSSRDELAVRRHFEMLLKAGVDVVVVSWWGRVSRCVIVCICITMMSQLQYLCTARPERGI
jgi:hypothetical protein